MSDEYKNSDEEEMNENINKEGYLYCMYNPLFIYEGQKYFKCGYACDVYKRMNGYTTSYLEPCEIIHVSEILFNKRLAESILFIKLNEFRIKSNREFFQCDKELIISEINSIVELFKQYSETELIDMFTSNKQQSKDHKDPKEAKVLKQYIVITNKPKEEDMISEFNKINAINNSKISLINKKNELYQIFKNTIPEDLISKIFYNLCTSKVKQQMVYNVCYLANLKHDILKNNDIVINKKQCQIVNEIVKICGLKHCQDLETLILKSIIDSTLKKYISKNYNNICTSFGFEKNDNINKKNIDIIKQQQGIFYLLNNIFNSFGGCNLKVNKKESHSKKTITYKLSGLSFYEYISI